MEDVKKLGVKPDFSTADFACLLCGVSGEITAEEFIEFVLARNKKAKIVIIDRGQKQVEAVRTLVKDKYKTAHITVIKMDALNIVQHFKSETFDWIETDGLIEYFDKPATKTLLVQWKRVLKKDGYITTRDFASSSSLGSLIDRFRMWFIKRHLTLVGHIHTKKQLDSMFTAGGFRFVSGPTPVPTLKRYALALR